MIADRIRDLIEKALISLGQEADDFVVEHPSDLKMGDYSTNVAIKFRDKKDDLYRYIATNKLKEIERVEIAGPGFINFYLSKEFIKKNLEEIIDQGNEFGKSSNLKGKKFLIEHTQPNPFKTFHIGHLMNNIIGQSIVKVIEANGAEVKSASYHGDIGLHIAKALWGMMRGEKDPYPAGSKAYDEDEESRKEIQAINKKIYNRSDESINKLYDMGKSSSLESFFAICRRLGTEFDFSFFESEAGIVGKKIVLEFLKKGVFEESEGATIFRGEKFGLHTRVFLNSDGLPTYEAKEIGLAKIKKEKVSFDRSLTITGNEQDTFFKVIEVVVGEIFPELKGKLKHLSHGMLRLPTGKMSSRKGSVIAAEEFIDEIKGRVKSDEAVAIGAIKYMILRQTIGNDIIFDINKSVSTEGDSGVYLQYAYARTCSLLDKAPVQGEVFDYSGHADRYDIERLLYRFPEIVEKAGKEYAPHYIVEYLTDLTGSFNNFYAHHRIISDLPESSHHLLITRAFNIVMKNGLTMLGMPTPERI